MLEDRLSGMDNRELDHMFDAVRRERELRLTITNTKGTAPSSLAATDREFVKAGVIGDAVRAGLQQSSAGGRWTLTVDNVEEAFRYHPWDAFQADAGAQVRDALVAAAKVILRVVPEGPDKSVALRKLREVRMDCNSSITHGGRF